MKVKDINGNLYYVVWRTLGREEHLPGHGERPLHQKHKVTLPKDTKIIAAAQKTRYTEKGI